MENKIVKVRCANCGTLSLKWDKKKGRYVTKSSFPDELESLYDYQEFLCDKYGFGLPSWARTKEMKPITEQAEKEMKRVTKKIEELARCKRHKGVYGLDCNPCRMEGRF